LFGAEVPGWGDHGSRESLGPYQPSGDPGFTAALDLAGGAGSVCGAAATGCVAANGGGAGTGFARRRGNVFAWRGFGEGGTSLVGVMTPGAGAAGGAVVVVTCGAGAPCGAVGPSAGWNVGLTGASATALWSCSWFMTTAINTPTIAMESAKTTSRYFSERAQYKFISRPPAWPQWNTNQIRWRIDLDTLEECQQSGIAARVKSRTRALKWPRHGRSAKCVDPFCSATPTAPSG